MKKDFIKKTAAKVLLLALPPLMAASCEKVPVPGPEDRSSAALEEIAGIFSNLQLQKDHLREVHSAVSASLENGYDEEYTMADLFSSPGSGVGSSEPETKGAATGWPSPLRDLLSDYLRNNIATRSESGAYASADEYIAVLAASDIQIYWPYSENWNGESYPIITFDPGSEVQSNIGYQMSEKGCVGEVVVNEKKAEAGNVWVMNRNDDSGYRTLEMLLRENPDLGGGHITVNTKSAGDYSGTRTLLLKSFEVRRNYDCWFAGASEFGFLTLNRRCAFVNNIDSTLV